MFHGKHFAVELGEAEAALAVLGARYGLSDAQIEQLAAILSVLATDVGAPSSVTDPLQAVDVHLADSLSALELAPVRGAERAVDIGAGAGFPGLPLAVALPGSEVRLVESQTKKCRFLRRVTAAAGVNNAPVVERRVEQWPEGLGVHDAALARALAAPAVVLEYAAPLLARGGVLLDWRGRRNAVEEEAARVTAAQLGLELVEIRAVQPFAAARDRHLHVYLKTGETPERFPRRAGMARKKPLGGARARAAG